MALADHTDTTSDGSAPAHPRASFTSFEESTAEDWAIITPQIRHTQNLVADRVIELMRALETDFGGFPVNRLEHSLQTATRAERDGKDDEYVLCALLHDIGDTVSPFNHPDIAAGILKPFVSEANHWMVEHHGIFQMYYYAHHCGGDRNAREIYRDNPWYQDAIDFCHNYDQNCFDPNYDSEPLEFFEPILRRVITTPSFDDSEHVARYGETA